MSTVYIPAPLRRLTGGIDRAEASGQTVGELIDDLEARFPGLRAAFVENGNLVPHLAVSVDDVVASAGLDEPVAPESEVHFVPPLGGG
ncbi:MAG: MoaD/ThiS family protein [Candidatus Binatia bacterium]|nr:MoaD/ThiS family protein [Candidatus Binatia bacterium]